ncbi:MAG: SusD/RagB family nutrient-binding outer membrane lipoprotein [Chitinophagales bacterium]
MKKIMFLLFGTALVASSCKKQLDVNQNPNQPTAVTPNVILSAALVGTASNNFNDYLGIARWMGYWSRSGNYVPDVQTETYNIANDFSDAEWGNIYVNLNNYDYMENTGRSLDLPFYIGVAKVMKAYCFSTLVDIYNNIPYKQAFKVTTVVQPPYDDAQTVYNDLVAQLDSAIDTYFESAKTFYDVQPASIASTDDQYDVLFGSARTGVGDATSRLELWQRFANTIKLKLLIHQSQVGAQAAFIATEIQKITDNGFGLIGANQSASTNPGYQASTGKISPLFGVFNKVDGTTTVNFDFYRANTYAVNFYINSGDERQALLYTGTSLTPGSNYDGDPAAVPNSQTSGVGPGLLKGFTQDAFLFSDFESLFLQAEAVQRGWLTGSAQSLYESAVTQNYVYLNQGTGLIADPVGDAGIYLSQGIKDADWTATPDKFELILTQKWAAMNGVNWVEAYSDFRRTGFPKSPTLDISHAPSHLVPQIPVRLLYPQSEFNTNGKNVPALGQNAQFTAKVFWNQ